MHRNGNYMAAGPPPGMAYANDVNMMAAEHDPNMILNQQSKENIQLKRLDDINKSIESIPDKFEHFLDELSKEKQSQNNKNKQAKQLLDDLIRQLRKCEEDLLNEINFLGLASTGYPHEGSIYGARKEYDLSKMRLSLIAAHLGSLKEKLSN